MHFRHIVYNILLVFQVLGHIVSLVVRIVTKMLHMSTTIEVHRGVFCKSLFRTNSGKFLTLSSNSFCIIILVLMIPILVHAVIY